MIYCFVSDEAFAVTDTGLSVLAYENVISSTLGMIDDNLLNYFVDHGIIVDPIGNSNATNRTARIKADDSNTTHGSVSPNGRMNLHFDQSKVTDSADSGLVSTLTIATSDGDATIESKTQLRAALFNIIETIYMAHNTTALGSTAKTVSEIETIFNKALDTTYQGYVSDSLQLSTTTTASYYYYDYTANNVTTRTVTTTKVDFYDYFDFDFNYGDSYTTVRVWLSVPQFKANYPYSTIMNVIYPCDPSWILNPESTGGEMAAVLSAATYRDSVMDTAVTDDDHSGATTFVSRYVHASVSSDSRMSFLIMYKGVAPTAESMRIEVRERLLAETDSLGRVLATEDEWKAVLPDLFIDASFYLFPCYFQRQTSLSSTTIEQSIANYRSLYNKTCNVLTSDDSQTIFDYMEILQIPGSKIYMVAYPVEGTSNTYTSILELHPTYQAVDSIGSLIQYTLTTDTVYTAGKTYCYQETDAETGDYTVLNYTSDDWGTTLPEDLVLYERTLTTTSSWSSMTSVTKNFAQLLANCYAVCLTPSSTHASDFTESLMNGRTYYSFSSNFIEYHMLSYESAAGTFGEYIEEDCEHVDGYIH